MHVLVVEYPGYGLYKGSDKSPSKMLEDSIVVFDYLTTVCGVKAQDIVLFGRSIGSGPATYLGA